MFRRLHDTIVSKTRLNEIINAMLYLTVILRGRAGYELIYITNEAVNLVN